ncbi:MAG: glycosyltransferase [Spirochaetia bacterium]|nr:glycosyltransferase [Spirochaetia bacterium]
MRTAGRDRKKMRLYSVNIAVLNYNGRQLLDECMPSILEATAAYPGRCTVTVIDNKSTDGSVEFLKKKFGKKISVFSASENRVLISYNEYVKTVVEEIVIILDNDMKLDRGFVLPLIRYFERPDTFFVSPKHLSFDGKEYQGGKNKIVEKPGFISAGPFYRGYERETDISSRNLFTGNGAFRASIFNELGGFDPLFLPGGMEDTDICVRAWKAGYCGYYEPKSALYHKGSATFKKEFSNFRRFVNNYRNSFLFAWKNISGMETAKNLLLLPFTFLVFLLTFRYLHIAGLCSAVSGARMIKKQDKRSIKRSFTEVKKITSKKTYLPVFDPKKITGELSIVIPAYNRKKDLLALLDSLLKQKYDREKVEIIVSDDGSTDGTGDALKPLMKRHKELKYVYQKNAGPSAARNNGIRVAAGRIIGLLDSDVIADKNLIRSVLSEFSGKIDVLEGTTLSFERDIKNTAFTHSVQNKTGGRWITCNLFILNEKIHGVGGFDEEFRHPIREDTALGFSLLESGAVSKFSKKVVVYHPVYRSDYKMLFKLAFYGIYEPMLIRKYPGYYFKYLNWIDSWFFPSYYSGYYAMPFFVMAWLLTGRTVFAYAAAALYAASYVISVYAVFRNKKVLLRDILTVGFHYIYIPYLRLYWIIVGIFKF